MPEAKAEIARTARPMLRDGSTVFLDSSTSCLALAQLLKEEPPTELTLVTNSPAIIDQIDIPAVHVIVVPGDLDQSMRTIGGPWAEEFISRLHFRTAFISAAGVRVDNGILVSTERRLADLLSIVIEVSSEVIVLVDSSKFGRLGLVPITGSENVTTLIADAEVPAEARANLGDRLRVTG